MKTNILTLFILSITAINLIAQEGDVFPEIEVVDLNENSLTIPNDTKDKFTLIGVAFSEDAQEDLYTWSQPIFSRFMDENNLSSLVYDPHIKLILMFTGVNQIAFKKAKERITDGTDETLKDNVVLYKGKMEDYRKKLDMKKRKVPHFFVLDKEGKIIYVAEGPYSEKVLDEVSDLIAE